ncbi:MAG TPA: hypothetical protein VGD65_24980 [Chryseosolibacter sp.]
MKKIFPFLGLSVVLLSCDALTGEEIARLSINQVSTEGNLVVKEATLDLKKDDEIAVWSDMDLEYEGDVQLRFRLQVWKDGKQTGAFEIDPTEKRITLGEFKTTLMNKTEWTFSGKNSDIKIDEDGNYTLKAILVASDNSTLKVNKAEVFFKK